MFDAAVVDLEDVKEDHSDGDKKEIDHLEGLGGACDQVEREDDEEREVKHLQVVELLDDLDYGGIALLYH